MKDPPITLSINHLKHQRTLLTINLKNYLL